MAPEGIRYYTLFSFAPGTVRYPLTVAQCHMLGMYMAQIHQTSNSFSTSHPRHHFDLAFLLDDAIERIKPFLHAQSDVDINVIETAADLVRAQVANITRTEDTYGIIGGDFHGYNNHFTDSDDLTFFDFELCGYGWRAYDLAVFLWNARSNNTPSEWWEAVLQGYQTVRQLTQAEQAALPTLIYARHIWLMGAHTRARERFGDAWLSNFYWKSNIQRLTDPCIDYEYRGSQPAMTRRYENTTICLRHRLARRTPFTRLGTPPAGMEPGRPRLLRCCSRGSRPRAR
jgi:Ser/Thr protein kinase RdoA (MazF antagonist)